MRGGHKADWVDFAEARAIILGAVAPLPATRRSLAEALGHVLAESIHAPLDLPPWDNSAMDGFAARAEDVRGASEADPRILRVIEDVPAGSFPTRALGPGEACRVMTGAAVPQGADTVIRVEHTDGGHDIGGAGGRVEIRSDVDAGRNVRHRGEDLRGGKLVLERGRRLRAAEIGVAASLGRSRVEVVRRPRVAVLASGDELVDVDGFAEVLAGRRIVSSNSHALGAQLREAGMEVVDLGIARDHPASVRERLEGARGCDALITSAGISVGEHDYMREVLEELGVEVAFWRIRMRPGSPVAFGRVTGLGGIPWFGLPGNPVSSMVTFEVLARPALLRMAGEVAVFHPVVTATVEGEYPTAPGLTHFPRVRIRRDPQGETVASLTGAQGSGILTSMVAADALLVVPESAAGARDGDRLPALLLGGMPRQTEPGF